MTVAEGKLCLSRALVRTLDRSEIECRSQTLPIGYGLAVDEDELGQKRVNM